ncbi:MAG: acetate--CoA ligase family protein [Candidatus Hermodarchaeota archaeon]
MTKEPNIIDLFEPQGIAVIGASSNKAKIGYKIVENIVSGGYRGKVYPVNPRGGEIPDLGLRMYKSVEDIDGKVELVIISIPAKYVLDAVMSCQKKENVQFLCIISSGFSEVGNTEEERKIVAYANDHGMRVLGPNVFGLYSAKSSLNATFGPKNITKGNVAIVTQSGALGIAMIGMTAVENMGLSSIISVGNKSDIDEADLLEYLVKDEDTKVIMLYIEGVHEGEKLVKVFKRATKVKPVIVIKSGRSKRGAIAAASHTGSLAGSDTVFDKIMQQCGVLRAESLEDAFEWCKFLANNPLPQGEETIIITNGGGVGVMATDASEKYDVRLYDDQAALKEMFKDVTPDFGSTKNPIDITGQASSQDYNSALNAALTHEEISAVMSLYCETAILDLTGLESMMMENYLKYKEAKKPVLFSLIGGEKITEAIKNLRQKRVPVFSGVYEAVSCFGAMYRHYRYLKEPFGECVEANIDIKSINEVIKDAREDKRTFLLTNEAQTIMRAANVKIPETRIARTIDEAVIFAEEIKYPVVMKIVSKDIVHKSDAGGVALDLENKEEVIDAFQAIMHNARAYNPTARIEGIEITEMVTLGTEIIIGARRDAIFGPIIMIGLGGIYVEVMKDVSFRAWPLDRKEITSMIKETKCYSLLLGVRGEPRKEIEELIDTIVKLGTIIQKCKDISDIEINPLMVYEMSKGVKAVDVRILLSKA